MERLHDELFFRPWRAPDPGSTLELLEYLGDLAALAELRAYVVGSLLYAPSSSRDVDLLLAPRQASPGAPDAGTVEEALIACMAAGCEVAGVRVDPTYRPRGAERRLGGRLSPDTLVVSWRLEDPGTTLREAAGLESALMRTGEVSILDVKPARDCAFYRKLPPLPQSPQVRWLAPAVPVEEFTRRLRGAGGDWPAPIRLTAA